jgi:hypothetical protein
MRENQGDTTKSGRREGERERLNKSRFTERNESSIQHKRERQTLRNHASAREREIKE